MQSMVNFRTIILTRSSRRICKIPHAAALPTTPLMPDWLDGDLRPVGVVSRSGHIIAGDRLLMLFAAAELKKRAGHVLYDVKSSRLVASWVAMHGAAQA